VTGHESLLPARPGVAREALCDHAAALRVVGDAMTSVGAAAFWRATGAKAAVGYGYDDRVAGLKLAAAGAVDAAGTETGR